ncbi:hypothetical protein WICMUC_002270 [Wickerhamomyces mucosus]|uniref:Sec20 C-terminal domain-containing protein n=1 Tax=Wickerhamomyces mucosus TaxID=1378264 RepID=A0A9P8PRG4_9ASCO|nr:hypothetical protein WICMUC_002270 [Wickerhamomyces mucosus]
MDLSSQFSQLYQLQQALLTAIHQMTPINSNNESLKTSIINDLYKFNEIISFIAKELKFQYDFPPKIDSTSLDYAVEFDKHSEFFLNFKKNFISLQFKLRNESQFVFQSKKQEKYKLEDLQIKDETTEEEGNLNKTIDSKIHATNKKITSKLKQSSQVLQNSLLQSQLNLEDLTIQDSTLLELSENYTSLRGVLNKSDEFVKNIKLSNKRDKQRMYYAIIFFALSCAKVVWSRLLRFPYRILRNIIFSLLWILGLFKHNDSSLAVYDSNSPAYEIGGHEPSHFQVSNVIEAVKADTYHTEIHKMEPIVSGTSIDGGNVDEGQFSENFDEQLERIIDEL